MLNLHKIFLPEDTLHKRKKTPLYVSIERPCHCPLDWLVVDYKHHSGMLTSANLGKEGESTFFVLFSERLFHFNPRPIHLNPYPQIQSSESFFILTNSLPMTCYLSWRSADLKGGNQPFLVYEKGKHSVAKRSKPQPRKCQQFQ